MDLSNNFRGEFKVTFKKKEHDALFTMNTLRILLKNEKIELKDFDKWVSSDPLTSVPMIAYYSVVNSNLYAGKKFKADKELFIAEILDTDQLETVSESIAEAMGSDESGKK
jgi:hypothetical protein|tara:strand:+ start:1273 stop:1605 length:333 start_codon:yes stop_codon:yes gene_type:complete